MDLGPVNLEAAADPGRAARVLSWGRWLVILRAIWPAVAVLALGIYFASIPAYTLQLGVFTESDHLIHKVNPEVELPAALEFSVDVASMIIALASSLMCLILAGIIFRRKRDQPIAVFVSLFLLLYGVIVTGPLETLSTLRPGAVEWELWAQALLLAGPGTVLLYLFPNGRFVPPWTRWFALILVIWTFVNLLFPMWIPLIPDENPASLVPTILWYMSWPLTGAFALVYRYVRVSNTVERFQIKWVVFGYAAWVTVGWLLTVPLSYYLISPAGSAPPGLISLSRLFWWLSLSIVPLTISIAILRYRLWDIDVIINRALVYGGLTTAVVGLYVFIVGYLGSLLHIPGEVHQATDLVVSLIATGIVAVIFQPLRDRLQRRVNRLMYGERDDPYAVLSRLGKLLEATLTPEAVLPSIVETVAQALKLSCVAIALKESTADEFKIVAVSSPNSFSHPAALGSDDSRMAGERLPLVYQGEVIGKLIFSPRGPDESFTAAERRLLADIAHQASLAAHAVRLSADLQHSRERIVTGREEERRRLRRDLHDGLGPALASLTLKLDAARNLLVRDPAAADALLAELKAQTQTAVADIRRLAYNLRPPALDEFGLAAAIREHVTSQPANGLHITVEAPESFPPLPAAVEVAAYRISLEALTNVIRHARARECVIRLSLSDALQVEVIDNGLGLKANALAGVGLTSMRERAAELGGTCVIERIPTGGTRVFARLPLSTAEKRA